MRISNLYIYICTVCVWMDRVYSLGIYMHIIAIGSIDIHIHTRMTIVATNSGHLVFTIDVY